MASQETLRYACKEQNTQNEDNTLRRAWRFEAFTAQGQSICAVDDICESEQEAHQLQALFERNQVAPEHIMDVLEDWVEEKYNP